MPAADQLDAQCVTRVEFGPFELNITERTLKRADEVIPLGARAFDILVTLVDRPGEVVDKSALISKVWPDVTVEEGSLRVHLSALRKALSDGQLGSKYIANVQGRGYSFVAPVARHGIEIDRSNSLAQGASLPVAPSGMIGRDDVVVQICARLRTERLITVVGAGGIGKTTVALAVAHAVSDDFSGAVIFVDLSIVKSRDQVVVAIASAIGLVLPPVDPERALLEFLLSRRALLILDSCEHLVEQVAEIADRIFHYAPDVRLLATSREALQTAGEHVFRLQPLSCPPEQPGQTMEEIFSYPAAQLFVERLSAQGVDLQLSTDDATLVAEICRRLDGIALAIELVARQAAAFGVRNTAARLASLDLLKFGRRTANPRHQTLRATLDWSHDLLSEVERVVLRRVAIFMGCFTLDCASAVAADEGLGQNAVLDAVGSLVEKSLIVSRIDSLEAPYRLLDMTRSYAIEKLVASGEHETIAIRYATGVAEMLEAKGADFRKAGIPKDRLLAKDYLGNARAALEWSFGPGGNDALAIRLAAAAGPLFLAMSLLTECRHWMQQALDRMPSEYDCPHQLEVRASFAFSLMFTEGNSDKVRAAFDVAFGLAERFDDICQQMRLLTGLAMYFQQLVDGTGMLDLALRAEAIARKNGNRDQAAIADSIFGPAYFLLGDQSRAQKHLERALDHLPGMLRSNANRYLFDPVLTQTSLSCNLFRSHWMAGNIDRAVAYAGKTIEDAERSDNPMALFRAQALATSLYFWIDDLRRAERTLASLEHNVEKNALGLYSSLALGLRGQYFIRVGRTMEGMQYLRDALKRLAVHRLRILAPDFAADLAVCLAKQDGRAKALAVIDEAIASQDEVNTVTHLPALLLAKAQVFAHGKVPDLPSAEEYLERSVALAREQSALSFELRAGLRLAEIWIGSGQVERARELIGPIYSRFSEGFGTPDLVLTRQMLDMS